METENMPMEQEPRRGPAGSRLFLYAVGALVLAIVLSWAIPRLKGARPGKEETPAVAALPAGLDLEGEYDVVFTAPDMPSAGTATVRLTPEGDYLLTAVSEYGPETFRFTFSEADAQVRSDELGEGSVSYKESVGKITIRFEKEGESCELTK